MLLTSTLYKTEQKKKRKKEDETEFLTEKKGDCVFFSHPIYYYLFQNNKN